MAPSWHFIETDDPLEIQVKHSPNEAPFTFRMCSQSRNLFRLTSSAFLFSLQIRTVCGEEHKGSVIQAG